MAKLINELETLMDKDPLRNIDFVKGSISSIKACGIQLRSKAQESLLTALKEKNQASIAVGLQVSIVHATANSL